MTAVRQRDVPLVRLADLPGRPCPIAASLEVVGERWALLVVREVGLGARRFNEIVTGTGAPRDRIASRLTTLVEAGVLEKRQYQSGPPRFEYHLTDSGRALLPVLEGLLAWGRAYAVSPADPDLKRRRWAPWLIALALIAAAVAGGWYVYSRIQDELKDTKPVNVPPLVGLREEQAVDQIEKLGFKAQVEQGSSTEFDAGFVMEQSPKEGVKLPKGETVTIVVSQGAPKTDVPSVVGLTYDQAVDQLAQAKLKAKRKEVFSEKPAGEVVKQSPKAGESVIEGSTVTLNVSKGTETVPVPDVLQQSKASAEAELQAAGFTVTSTTAPSNDTPKGLVSSQTPSAGTDANKGSTVAIVISSGPSSVAVPNVVGQDQDTAERTLEDAGFVVTTIEEPTTDPTQDGLVVDQNPRGGVQASPGSTVQIAVATLATPRRRGP